MTLKTILKNIPLLGITLKLCMVYFRLVRWRLSNLGVPPALSTYSVRRLTPADGNYFFGYYDKCPWDNSGLLILSLRASFGNRMPRPGETAYICLVSTKTKEVVRIGTTSSWCWQQGCMLQWIQFAGEECILFNDYRHGKYVTVVFNKEGIEQAVFDTPTYCISKDYEKIISLNFNRLHYCRPGYGYISEKFMAVDESAPGKDGLWLYDLIEKRLSLIVSLREITQYNPKDEFKDSFHYFIHIEFNPSSTRIVFYHRWQCQGLEKTRMFTCNPDGSDLYLLSDSGMVSHYTWEDDKHLIAWADGPHGMHYYRYTDRASHIKVVGQTALTEDGHPSLSADGKTLLTDTYPSVKNRRRSLMLFDLKRNEKQILGTFYVPVGYDGPIRCDLHPRFNYHSNALCIDSVHEGMRGMYEISL